MYKIRQRTQQETKLDVNQYIRICHKIKGGTNLLITKTGEKQIFQKNYDNITFYNLNSCNGKIYHKIKQNI